MNFNASRNVGQGGGLKKAKRVSDVAAMGTLTPAPAFSPGEPYNAGFPPASTPPPYQEGISIDNQSYGASQPDYILTCSLTVH
ncbi:hypothetical protein EVAR_83821_1 [Eumeta japonica]|uniref:Uncharacterized protein n=1 Tax=Eumeta variegata TaxID=151549 RepID=A0A4C1WH72_EUMVA|nr:hypothetical protein EVAR_83821_1 [Eumeta japonica]